MRVLSLSAERALRRLEIELCHHAGQDNGQLVVTFDDFEAYGVRRMSIMRALDELEALGLIKVTEHGKAAKGANYRRPNKFKLTTRPERTPGECRWQCIKTVEQAQAIIDKVQAAHGEKKKPPVSKRYHSPVAKRYYERGKPSIETILMAGSETILLSTSRGEYPPPLEDA